MDLQDLIDGAAARNQRERAGSQTTLGKLIEILESMPDDKMIGGICSPHSYRGYYCDLAFERGEKATVADTLKMCREAMGQVFQGYKGGDYVMGALTPVWISNYGDCGKKIMGLLDDGVFLLAADD